jgi:hypothetical protein
MSYAIQDAATNITKALPAAASTAANSDGIDTGKGTTGRQLADIEFLLSAPAVTTTMVPDTKTITYKIQHDNDSAFGSPTTLFDAVIVQTGAGGAGAAAATYRFRLPSTAERYIRAVATTGADTTDSSAVSMTLKALY